MKKVAIIGRPNVGKSALFNRICQKRVAIVDEEEGVTRDRLSQEATYLNKSFLVIDTAGIDSSSEWHEEVFSQTETAICLADSLILVVDAKCGLTERDREVARLALKSQKPLCLAINKVDSFSEEPLWEFASLGIEKMVCVSAVHGQGVMELLAIAVGKLEEEPLSSGIRVAIVGRTNVGKSSLFNTLLQQKRAVVSPIAGTTRDSIDEEAVIDGQSYIFIDTAGIRQKKKEDNVIEKFASIRTKEAIERADVCLLVLDASEGMTEQDKRIASLIESSKKGCVLLFNKWDLVSGFRMEHCRLAIEEEVPFLSYCRKLFISAKTGRNLEKIFQTILEVSKNLKTVIPTAELNRFVQGCIDKYHPPMIKGKRLKIYYLTQIRSAPPLFTLFVNRKSLFIKTYQKYLVNQFRESFPLEGVPVSFVLKEKAD